MKQYPHQFSGGQRQRIMIAMALALTPDLLIADEPTTALDVTIQAQILDLMLEMKERQKDAAILLITHNLAVVAETCDRVAVMYGGKIQEVAPVKEIFNNPMHPYTRGLLGSLPRVDGPRAERLTTIPGSVPDILDLPAGCKFTTRCPDRFEPCPDIEPALVERAPGHSCAATCTNHRRTAAPGASRGSMPPILEVKDLHVRFPVFGGLLLRKMGEVHAVNGVSFALEQGRDARPGRRVRLRQDDGRPRDHQHPARDELQRRDHGRDSLSPPVGVVDLAPLSRARDAPVPHGHPDDLSGSVLVAESADDRRADRRRAAEDPHEAVAGGTAATA